MANNAYRYKEKADLTVINVWQGSFEEPTDHEGCLVDSWGNCAYEIALVDGGNEEFVPDFDGTSRDSEGIALILPTEFLDRSVAQLRDVGFEVEIVGPPEPGHHGDGQWAGVELAEYQGGWIMFVN